MATKILIDGKGLLADKVVSLLSANYSINRQSIFEDISEKTDFVLVLHDSWYPSLFLKVEKRMRELRLPWLRGFVSFGEGIIGPFVQPNNFGCSYCADLRRIIAGPDRQEMWNIQQTLSISQSGRHDAWVTYSGLFQMATLITNEVHRFFHNKESNLEEKIIIVHLKTLKTSNHFFLPDPTCPMCSSLPKDSPGLARINLQSIPKINGSYRSRTTEELKTVLSKGFLDSRTGLMNGKMQDIRLPFADVLVNMPLLHGDEGVAGRTNSYETSELTALLEGLERYCGIEPRGKVTVVHGSYNQLKKDALDLRSVGVHEDEQYDKPNFPFKKFNPDTPMDWVWGYSFLQKRPILVPKLLAYYSVTPGKGFVYETSNGCALGGSLEEAIFHAIMEVVERDSFLLTWYARLPLRRLDPRSANDKELQLMVDRIRDVTGYDLFFYNSTMEHGIPSVWAVAKNRNSKGLNLICAAGANPDPVKAVKSTIFEIAGMMFRDDEKLEANRHIYERMLHDPFAVRNMEDHGMLYGLKEAEERLDFLLNNHGPFPTFEEEFKKPPSRLDLKDDLEEILQRFHRLNLDVIVVDQSTPITKRNGLYCVKVLIPGMLPMTFGHHLTRVKGLERVLTVPMQLGYTKKSLTYDELNPYPHPFP